MEEKEASRNKRSVQSLGSFGAETEQKLCTVSPVTSIQLTPGALHHAYSIPEEIIQPAHLVHKERTQHNHYDGLLREWLVVYHRTGNIYIITAARTTAENKMLLSMSEHRQVHQKPKEWEILGGLKCISLIQQVIRLCFLVPSTKHSS